MEQRDMVDELLALRKEVQELKFLSGGSSLSDLISRIGKLEAQPKSTPNFNNMIWSMVFGRETNPHVEIFPEWVNVNTTKQFAVVPRDGILLMQVYVSSLIKEQHDDIVPDEGNTTESSRIRISTGTIDRPLYLITSETTVRATDDIRTAYATQALPVAAGTPLLFNACINPNHGNNRVLLHLYDFMS